MVLEGMLCVLISNKKEPTFKAVIQNNASTIPKLSAQNFNKTEKKLKKMFSFSFVFIWHTVKFLPMH